jgi:hypothetical protein
LFKAQARKEKKKVNMPVPVRFDNRAPRPPLLSDEEVENLSGSKRELYDKVSVLSLFLILLSYVKKYLCLTFHLHS